MGWLGKMIFGIPYIWWIAYHERGYGGSSLRAGGTPCRKPGVLSSHTLRRTVGGSSPCGCQEAHPLCWTKKQIVHFFFLTWAWDGRNLMAASSHCKPAKFRWDTGDKWTSKCAIPSPWRVLYALLGVYDNSSDCLALGVIEGSRDFDALMLVTHKRLMFNQPGFPCGFNSGKF